MLAGPDLVLAICILVMVVLLLGWWGVVKWGSGLRDVDEMGRCGECDYLVVGLTKMVCPECGSDLRDVGIKSGQRSVRMWMNQKGKVVGFVVVWVWLCGTIGYFCGQAVGWSFFTRADVVMERTMSFWSGEVRNMGGTLVVDGPHLGMNAELSAKLNDVNLRKGDDLWEKVEDIEASVEGVRLNAKGDGELFTSVLHLNVKTGKWWFVSLNGKKVSGDVFGDKPVIRWVSDWNQGYDPDFLDEHAMRIAAAIENFGVEKGGYEQLIAKQGVNLQMMNLYTQFDWKFATGFNVVWSMWWVLICALGLWVGVKKIKRDESKRVELMQERCA
ncbi:hypothetical protein JD969_06115 [Planctomycetota bacterium]|nr:hypothetical protein JD969_06115 [Planctomycetota bacterium]